MTDLYAVMGDPIEHSRSPKIHAAFAKQTQQDMSYEKIHVPLDQFKSAIKKFRTAGGMGLNITLPLKTAAFELCDKLTSRALQAGAVNTIIFHSNYLLGDNTDGIGLVNDLKHKDVTLKNKRILIIGASGAARGVIQPILDESPDVLHIANRTKRKADILYEQFQNITASSLSDCPENFDVVINATSTSLQNTVPEIKKTIFEKNACAYDMVYGDKQTSFQRWAIENGAKKTFDGFGMLVEQAAESFFLWRGVRPSLDVLQV